MEGGDPHAGLRRFDEAPVHHRGGGQVSRLLTAGSGARAIAVTWVQAAPGSEQSLHAHEDCEQIYVVVEGKGTMTVNDERFAVGPGDLVAIPPGTPHAIYADEPLIFITATSPPFGHKVQDGRWYPDDLPDVAVGDEPGGHAPR